jgi:acetyl-CoA carboxylase carboxyltransferase component
MPANTVIGQGEVEGRGVVVQGDDFTIRGGAADAAIWQKMVHAERMAHDLRLPLIRLVDGTGGGGSVKSLEQMGFTYVPFLPGMEIAVENLAIVPVVAAALGPVAGLGAARVVASHFSVIVRGTGQLFVAGPPVVAAAMGEAPDKEALGGARAQTRAGAVDNEAAGEEDAFAQIRRFLSYLPANAWELPPVVAGTDPPDRRDEALLGIVPRDPRKPYAMRQLLEAVLDRGSIFELGARHGRSVICALARLDGRPVGVLASDPKHYGGGLTGDASDKLVRFVDLCDQFRLPVANFVDQPGFVIGTEAERAGTMRRGARALFAVHQASVPWASVLVRKVYGVAGAAHGDASRLNVRYAWPSGDWGSLPIAGGLEAAYRRDLEAAEDPVALRAEIEARLNAVRSPFRTAERFGVEEIVDPRDTRPLLCAWARRAHELIAHERGGGPKARGPRP